MGERGVGFEQSRQRVACRWSDAKEELVDQVRQGTRDARLTGDDVVMRRRVTGCPCRLEQPGAQAGEAHPGIPGQEDDLARATAGAVECPRQLPLFGGSPVELDGCITRRHVAV